MRPYEVMIILEANLEEDDIRKVVDGATKLVKDSGGVVAKVDRWGKRRFAYEVHHKTEGYYVLVEATAEPETVADLSRMLGLADEVIRYKVIRIPDKVAGRKPRPQAAAAAGPKPNGA